MQVQPLATDLPPGTVVGGYEITHKVGQGGMGQVYAATHPLIGKKVAIKMLAHHCVQVPDLVRRFIEEARAVNKIGHANIIDIFSFGQIEDGRHFMVMEFLEGETLADRLHRETIPTYELRVMLRQICEALEAAHRAGIVHRDLKPANIWITRRHGEISIKLLDFGIAKLLGGGGKRITQTGATVGTPHFMPPEQCLGRHVDHRADIYSFGVILYFVFTGVMPFRGTNMADIVYLHTTEPPEPPSRHRPLPPGLEGLILDCLQKDPDYRPQSAQLLAQRLEEALTESAPGSMVAARALVMPTKLSGDRRSPTTEPMPTTTRPGAQRRFGLPTSLLALGCMTVLAGALVSRFFGADPHALDGAARAAVAETREALLGFARELEPRAKQAAAVPELIHALDVAENDATTFQDLFANEDWWRPYRTPPSFSALVTSTKVLATVGSGELDLVEADLVERARDKGLASGVVGDHRTPFAAAAARVTGWRRRAADNPTVVLGAPLIEAARRGLGRARVETIGLAQGGKLLDAVGEGEARAALARLVTAPVLEGRGVLLREGWGGARSSLGRDLGLLCVFRAPAPHPLARAAMPLALAGVALLLLGLTILIVRSRTA
jgi:tRNA A-37 threonylcarbamoyl transferase component Bud32